MKIFTYFIEPACYTIDLINNIYEPLKIKYCFIKSYTEVKTKNKILNVVTLSDLSAFKKIFYIWKVRRENQFIIVNAYNTIPFVLTLLFNFFSVKKVYIAIESDTQLNIPKNILKRVLKKTILSFIFRNRFVVGFSGGNYSHKDFFRNYKMKEDRIFLMPMMVDNQKFYSSKKHKKSFVFLFVGRLIKRKNIESLILQFNKYFTDKNVTLRIVGGGDLESVLKKKYNTANVNFIGRKYDNDLIEEFKNASVFICPSLFEPWGLVVNEALAAGIPVIAHKNVGASSDLIKNKKTGFIVNSNDEIGEKMEELFFNKELRHTFAANANKLMKDEWNYDLYKRCILKAIKKIEKWD